MPNVVLIGKSGVGKLLPANKSTCAPMTSQKLVRSDQVRRSLVFGSGGLIGSRAGNPDASRVIVKVAPVRCPGFSQNRQVCLIRKYTDLSVIVNP